MNQFLTAIIGIVFVLALLGFSKPAMLYPAATADGTITLTDLGGGLYKFELTSISDSGRAINYYWQSARSANMKTGTSVQNPSLPNINVDNLQLMDNQMFLSTGCIKEPVGIVQPYVIKAYAGDGGYFYAMGVNRGFGAPYCNGGQCQGDCDANVGSTTIGYMIFKDTTYVPPITGTTNTTTPVTPTQPPGTPAQPQQPKNLLELIIIWIGDGWQMLLRLLGMGGSYA